jgi:hypothetical protein
MSPFAASDRLGPPASRSIGSDVEIKFTRLCTEKRMLCSPPTPSAPPRHGLIAEAGGFGMLAPPIILHPDEHGDNSYRQPNKERANISPVIVMTKDSLHRLVTPASDSIIQSQNAIAIAPLIRSVLGVGARGVT